LLIVLESMFEADLQAEQYAYHTDRGAWNALNHVRALLQAGDSEVVDADLSGDLQHPAQRVDEIGGPARSTTGYKGRTLRVQVLPQGFLYAGHTYPSLSAVAKAVTGSHCNGYLFFRLTGKGVAS
jgi:hypothetical protein